MRAGHGMSIDGLVGYFQDVYLDPEDDQFLSATVEFTEPDAFEKWERGTWRSRSIEIGMYETNDGRSFWPVVMGLAWVDIPAVEGLHARQQHPQFNFSTYVTDNEEGHVPPDINKDPEGWTAAVNYAAWEQAANYAQACQNWEKAVNYAAALEREAANQPNQPSITGGDNPPADPPTPPANQPANHGAQPPQMMVFRVNGQPTSDFSAIQSHIDALEGYRSESMEQGRKDFVEGLAKDNKIPATQIQGLTAHALSLDDTQFATFRAMYENAPAMPGFANFGQQPNNGGPGEQQNQGVSGFGAQQPADEVETAKEIVAQHRRAGMSEEKVKATPSYQKLVAAGVATN